MRARPGTSIRAWQTTLFVAVIVVAILILSGSVSAGLRATLVQMTQTSELRNASALSQRLEGSLPIGVTGTEEIRRIIGEYRDIYGGGIWLYDAQGDVLESAYDGSPLPAELENAFLTASTGRAYARTDFRPDGWVVAAKPLETASGELQGVVVTASSVAPAAAILRAVRERIWVAFWVSLAIAGLLGLAFAEFISRRIKAMSQAAAAITAGDFDQRLTTRFVPNEMSDLADSFNRMAHNLGEAFGEIEESRREIAAVVESMAEGVVAFDADGFVRVINPEAVTVLSLPAQDHIGSTLSDIIDTDDLMTIVRAALRGEAATQTVTIGSFVVLAHSTPLLDARGGTSGAVLLLADVTEATRIEDAQRRFVADASHELRTPIAALKGMLELLDDGAKDVPEVRDDFISTMQNEVERLGRLVADMLTLAQLDAGSLRLTLNPEPAVALIASVTRVMQGLADPAGVTLSMEADDGLCVLADRDRIVQVLLSLTDNAVKHSSAGGTVHLAASATASGVRFAVADDGPGIAPDELPRVFERFYQVDAARTSGSGTGLGLAIAKEIIEAHGATIEASSALGEGTTFSFVLPACEPHEPAADDALTEP